MRAGEQRRICTHGDCRRSGREHLAEDVLQACTEITIALQQNVARGKLDEEFRR
jgi:hypothetical protein